MATVGDSSVGANGQTGPRSPVAQRENDLPPVPTSANSTTGLDPSQRQNLHHVLSSDIGISTLLARLKQSISSTRDYAVFLKDRSVLEEKHAGGLKRLAQNAHHTISRPESRQGSFATTYQEIAKMHERVAEQGLLFSNTLHAMSEELYELAANSERGRKHWKQFGLNAEKRVQDAEIAMDKAKGKYYSLAEQFDKVKTGERTAGKFGIKKNAAQQEEELQRKVEAADGDYASKTQYAQAQQQELHTTLRPQTVNALQDLIYETDAGLSAHIQKFAGQSERLLLGYGLNITPLKGNPNVGAPQKSLRELASSIDNDRDFADYVLSFVNKVEPRTNEIKYEKHPSFAPKQQQQSQSQFGGYNPDSFNSNQSQHNPYVDRNQEIDGYREGYGYGPGPQPHPPTGEQNFSQNQTSPRAPQQERQQSFGPPQLPQLDVLGSGQFSGQTSGTISTDGPPNHYRNVSQPVNSQGFGGSHNPRAASLGQRNDFGDSDGFTQDRDASSGPPQPATGYGLPSGPRPVAARQGSNDSRGGGNAFGMQQGVTGGAPPSGPPQGSDPRFGTAPPYPGAPTGPGTAPGQWAPSDATRAAISSNQGTRPSPAHAFGAIRPQGGSTTAPQAGGVQNYDNASSVAGSTRGPDVQDLPQNQGTQNVRPQNRSTDVSSSAPPAAKATPTQRTGPGQKPNMPPLKPVFAVSLDDLFQREESAVPTIVYQCIQAVDLYGLNTEGIYRTSGSANHIMELRQKFDHDSALVDFRNAAAFHDDIASVTTLLKHFLRDLPDPLLTNAQYSAYIQAAKIDDEIVRRDTIHALVNALPDPNYATLRVLALHLNRVAQHSDRNKMTHGNISIVFAPTLMGHSKSGGASGTPTSPSADIADAAWQAKVVETILVNTLQIFDDDE